MRSRTDVDVSNRSRNAMRNRHGCKTYRRLRQMTQRTQKQRIHNNLPTKLQKGLNDKQRSNIPEVAIREERSLRCVAEGEERECAR